MLGAAGTALGATALGVKANASHFRQCGDYWGNYGGCGFGYGYNGGCGENTVVNRFELQQSQRISELESANVTDAKLLEVYKAAALSDKEQDAKFAQLTKSLTDYIIANNRDCKTLPLEKKLPLSSICPQPLAGSTPIVANPQVITTTSATTNGEVQLNSLKVASTSK